MDQLPDVAGTDREKAFLRGQCLTLRAHFYFLLVNYFGAPYNDGDPEQNPGVPLKLESGVRDEYFTRASVAAVYRQMEQDLLEGNRLMTGNQIPVSVYEMSHLAAKALLSRVYLYMEDWDKAIDIADQLIQASPGLSAMSILAAWEEGSREQSGLGYTIPRRARKSFGCTAVCEPDLRF